jgi:hypothetical protein
VEVIVSDLVSGPLTGRFLRLEQRLEPENSLIEKALEHAWRKPPVWGRNHRGWCCSDLPHSGELREDEAELAYYDEGTGVWLMWLREEERTASRRAVETRAAQVAIDQFGFSLKDLGRDEQDEAKQIARDALLQRAVPKMRVLPFLVTPEWAWVGRRAFEPAYLHYLHPIIGRTSFQEVVWNPDEHGWHALSLASLQAYLESGEGFLDADVELVEVRFKGNEVKCQTEGANDQIRKAMSQIFEASSAGVTMLVFQVHMHGERVTVSVDQGGAFRGFPPSSAGGLLSERLLRRFKDYRECAERVGEVMTACYEARS